MEDDVCLDRRGLPTAEKSGQEKRSFLEVSTSGRAELRKAGLHNGARGATIERMENAKPVRKFSWFKRSLEIS